MSTSSNPLILVGAVVAFGALFGYLGWHRREETFTGEVIDKDMSRMPVNNTGPQMQGPISINMNNVRYTYSVRVKTDAGKSVNYQVSEGKYQQIQIGDRVSKSKGTTDLMLVSSGQNQTQPQASAPVQAPTVRATEQRPDQPDGSNAPTPPAQ